MSAAAEPLGPRSLLWRVGFPRTSLLLAGRALLLQVAHPTVGAGVRDFSGFRDDPWGRLDRTIASLLTQLFGGAEATAEAARLRRLHRSIAGTGFDGRPYRALEPDAYAWVHLSNADTVLRFHAMFGGGLDAGKRERLYADWRQAGRVLGIPDRDMPGDAAGLDAYVDGMVRTVLADNETVRDLLGALALDGVPPPRALPSPVWAALRPLGRTLLSDATVGTLPPALRARLGLPWGYADRRRLERIASVVRAASAGVPDRALHYRAAYLAMRAAR